MKSCRPLLCFLTALFFACQHNLDFEQSVADVNTASNKSFSENVSFRVNQATLSFNGKVLSDQLTLSQDSFGIFFLWVKGEGLFAITIIPISISVPAGHFTGNKMLIEYEKHEIELVSQSEHIFSDSKDRGAYLVYIPDYDMFGPNVKPADYVVGAVTEVSQIPSNRI